SPPARRCPVAPPFPIRLQPFLDIGSVPLSGVVERLLARVGAGKDPDLATTVLVEFHDPPIARGFPVLENRCRLGLAHWATTCADGELVFEYRNELSDLPLQVD